MLTATLWLHMHCFSSSLADQTWSYQKQKPYALLCGHLLLCKLGFCQDCSLVHLVSRLLLTEGSEGSTNIICRLVLSCLQRNNLSKDGALFKPHDVTQSNFRWDLPAGQVQYFYE